MAKRCGAMLRWLGSEVYQHLSLCDAPRRMNHDAERRATKFVNPIFRLDDG